MVAAATSLSPGFLTTASCALAAMLVTASHAQGASASPSLAFSSVPISNRSAECSAAISTSNDPLAVRFGCNPYGSHRRARGRGTASSCSSSGTSRKKRSESLLLRLMVPLSSSMSSYSSEDVFEAFGAFRDGMQVRGGATNFPGGGGGGREGKGGDNIIRRSATAGGVQEDGPFVLEGVKNIRDLGSIPNSGIVKGRVFRTGHLSDATAADTATLMDVTGLRTLVSDYCNGSYLGGGGAGVGGSLVHVLVLFHANVKVHVNINVQGHCQCQRQCQRNVNTHTNAKVNANVGETINIGADVDGCVRVDVGIGADVDTDVDLVVDAAVCHLQTQCRLFRSSFWWLLSSLCVSRGRLAL